MRTVLIGLGIAATTVVIAFSLPMIQTRLAIGSMRQLESEMTALSSDLVLHAKAVGCHWRYAYRTSDGMFEFDPAKTQCSTDLCRMGFDPDKAAVVPVDRTVKLAVTSLENEPRDFAVPPLGIKLEAVPGGVRETWFKALKPGIYSGQAVGTCSNDPSRIGIGIRAVEAAEWKAWLARRRGAGPRD